MLCLESQWAAVPGRGAQWGVAGPTVDPGHHSPALALCAPDGRWGTALSNSHIPWGISSSTCLGLFHPEIFAGNCAQDRLSFDSFVNSQGVCCLQVYVLHPFFCTSNLGLAGKIGCAYSPAHFLMIPVLKHRAGANLRADISIFD